MELFHRRGFLLKKAQLQVHLISNILVNRTTLRMVCLATSVALASGTYVAQSEEGLLLPSQDLRAAVSLGRVAPGVQAQMIMSGRVMKINVDGFNRQRENDIAKDSEKLLSLAIALKIELDRSPGDRLSADAIAKVKEIEKLAKDVKEKMGLTPALGPI
jgi:hypothetical protein